MFSTNASSQHWGSSEVGEMAQSFEPVLLRAPRQLKTKDHRIRLTVPHSATMWYEHPCLLWAVVQGQLQILGWGMWPGWVKMPQSCLTKIQHLFIFFLIKCFPGCCKLLVNFQTPQKFDSDSICCLFSALWRIALFPHSAIFADANLIFDKHTKLCTYHYRINVIKGVRFGVSFQLIP